MKKFLILIIVILLSFIGYTYFIKNKAFLEENRNILIDTTFITYVDTVEHVIKQTAVFDNTELKYLKDELKARNIDIVNLKKKVKGYKNLLSVMTTKIEVKDTIYLNSTITKDTLKVAYKDALLNMNGLYSFRDSTFKLDYIYTPSITTFQYKKNKDIFIDFSLNDKNSKVLSITSIKIDTKRKWYNKPVVQFSAGFLVGLIIVKK